MRARRTVMLVALALAAACSSESTSTGSTTTATTAVPATTAAPPDTTTPDTTPDTTTPDTTTPGTTPATTAPDTTAPPATTEPAEPADVKVYFLSGERMVIDHRDVVPPAVLRGAIEALLEGPTDPGHTTAIPAGTELRGVDLDDGVATIDLTAEFESGGGSMMMLARVGQVVFTATQFDNVDSVRFWLEGAAIDFLGGEGLVMTDPWTRAMVPRELTGPVLVDLPRPGDTVTSPIAVTGEADVYEGEFRIEIRRDSDVLATEFAIRGGAWGMWDEFATSIDVDAPPGPIEVVAIDDGGCGTDPECPPRIDTVVPLVLAD